MTLQEIINRINKDKSSYVNSESLFNEVGLGHEYVDLEDHGFTCYPIATWYCTDTHVGYYLICYKDKPIAITSQKGRKCDIEYDWIGGKVTRNEIREVLVKLVPQHDYDCKEADLNEEMGESYQVGFPSQLLTDRVVYNGELVYVIKTPSYTKEGFPTTTINIKKQTGEELTVSMEEVWVLFNIK